MKLNYCFLVWSLLFAFNPISGQQPFVCKGQYYLSLSEFTASISSLYLVEVDPVSSDVVFSTISDNLGATVNGMGYRKTDNFIYGVNPAPEEMSLYRLGADGVAVELGQPQGIILGNFYYYAGDISPDGQYLVLLGQSNFFNSDSVLAFIDLNHPDYQVTNVDMDNSYGGIYDIAFDPYTEELYGVSSNSGQLVKIDQYSGSITGGYPSHSFVNQMGALFFDVAGNLFGYGTINGEKMLVAIDKETGVIEPLAFGPAANGEDGCSCPYGVELQKTVSTDIALPCTEVIYTFTIINGSGVLQTGIQLTDVLPDGFTVLEILSNPYGGTETMNGHAFEISELEIPAGTDSIQVVVEIGQFELGLYNNQAVLSGLPEALGASILSDNPHTLEADDSTSIYIEPLDISFIEETYSVCPGEPLLIDVDLYGVEFLWEDGSTGPIRLLSEPGDYSVTVTSNCEQTIADFTIISAITEEVLQEQYFICEEHPLIVDLSNTGNTYQWQDGVMTPDRIIIEPGQYAVTVTAGCEITIVEYDIRNFEYSVDIFPEEIEIELGDQVLLSANYFSGGEAVSFKWQDPLENSLDCLNCLSTMAQPTSDVTYVLEMVVENGCIYEDFVFVRVKKNRSVFIPNVFSPNGDGINDYFYVQSKRDNVHVKKMVIFDRWGNLIHQQENLDVNQEYLGWDATRNGEPVNSGVYVYMLELEYLDGVVLLESGDVTIVR